MAKLDIVPPPSVQNRHLVEEIIGEMEFDNDEFGRMNQGAMRRSMRLYNPY